MIWKRWREPLNKGIRRSCRCDRKHMASIRRWTYNRPIKTPDVDALKEDTEYRGKTPTSSARSPSAPTRATSRQDGGQLAAPACCCPLVQPHQDTCSPYWRRFTPAGVYSERRLNVNTTSAFWFNDFFICFHILRNDVCNHSVNK